MHTIKGAGACCTDLINDNAIWTVLADICTRIMLWSWKHMLIDWTAGLGIDLRLSDFIEVVEIMVKGGGGHVLESQVQRTVLCIAGWFQLFQQMFSVLYKMCKCQHYYLLDFSCRKEGLFYHLPIICCIALPVSIHHPSSSSRWALYQLMPLFTRVGKYFPFLFSLETIFTGFFLYVYHMCHDYETAICILLQKESCVLSLNPKSCCIDVY